MYWASGAPFSAAIWNQRAAPAASRGAPPRPSRYCVPSRAAAASPTPALAAAVFEFQAPRPVGAGGVERLGQAELRPRLPGRRGRLEVAGGDARVARGAGRALLVDEAEVAGGARVARLRRGAQFAEVLAMAGVAILLSLAPPGRLLGPEGGRGGGPELATVALAHPDGVAEDGAGGANRSGGTARTPGPRPS